MIEWIPRAQRVPDDRRPVLLCCQAVIPPTGRLFVRVGSCNIGRDADRFDVENSGIWTVVRVTHWAEINLPIAPGHWRPPKPLPPTARPSAVDTLDAIDGTG